MMMFISFLGESREAEFTFPAPPLLSLTSSYTTLLVNHFCCSLLTSYTSNQPQTISVSVHTLPPLFCFPLICLHPLFRLGELLLYSTSTNVTMATLGLPVLLFVACVLVFLIV